MSFRFRDMIFFGCLFRGFSEIEIYYGWARARTALDGFGYILFCAVLIYGQAAIYDRWAAGRRAKHPQQRP